VLAYAYAISVIIDGLGKFIIQQRFEISQHKPEMLQKPLLSEVATCKSHNWDEKSMEISI